MHNSCNVSYTTENVRGAEYGECVKTTNRCAPVEGHCPVFEVPSKLVRWLPAKFISCLE